MVNLKHMPHIFWLADHHNVSAVVNKFACTLETHSSDVVSQETKQIGIQCIFFVSLIQVSAQSQEGGTSSPELNTMDPTIRDLK